MEMICPVCNTNDVKHRQEEGRGLPEKSYKSHPLMPKPRISWKGIWDIFTCNTCGNTWKNLQKNQ